MSAEENQVAELPRLAVFENQTMLPIFNLVKAASGLCRIVWIVGWNDDTPSRILSRLGDVADISGLDNDAVVEKLRGFQLDGVVVFSDAAMKLASVVAEGLGLPFHSRQTAAILSDKLLQRQALANAGIPGPAFASVNLNNFSSANVPFPAVLKPRAGTGGRDTFLAHSVEDVAEALQRCEPSEEFILEEWLPDKSTEHQLFSDVVSVETIAREGQYRHVMVSGRLPYAPPFRDTGGFVPSALNPSEWESACEMAGAAARAIGIREGGIHTEMKITPDGPRVVEVNGRTGGVIPGLIDRIGGPSLVTYAMKLALGQEVDEWPESTDTRVSYFHFVVAPNGATGVESVAGVSELSAMKEELGIDRMEFNLQAGDALDLKESSFRTHLLRVDGVATSHEEMARTIATIDEVLQVTWSYH
jgi:predicted ATP-grasp superfamily ATP-dependent carboligase